MTETLGIIAGGGELPTQIAKLVTQQGRKVFIIALKGFAEKSVESFPHVWMDLGKIGKIMQHLRAAQCRELTLIGWLKRSDYWRVKTDAMGKKLLMKILLSKHKGDDGLLRTIIQFLTKEGFVLTGAENFLQDNFLSQGMYTSHAPSAQQKKDIELGFRVVRALGALDIGQSCVVCRGVVLAVEAAEGTDSMIDRVGLLEAELRGSAKRRDGVLVKLAKPQQDLRVDRPTVGAVTVEKAVKAGLAGIAIAANQVLVVDRDAMLTHAQKHGVFVQAV